MRESSSQEIVDTDNNPENVMKKETAVHRMVQPIRAEAHFVS
jgi:hypothetical protein